MTDTFGRRGVFKHELRASLPRTPPSPQEAAASGTPFQKFIERVFLWLPDERSPGAKGVVLALVRQTLLPVVLGFIPIIILVLCGLNKAVYVVLTSIVSIGCQVIIQELNRYAFARRALSPGRALILITIVDIVVSLLFSHGRLYTVCWQLAAQLGASVALFAGIRYRRPLSLVVVAIILAETSVDVTAPFLFRPREAANPTSMPAATPAPVPIAGDMQSWAKLYPGSLLKGPRPGPFWV